MRILSESGTAADPSQLHDAWDATNSFCWLPNPCPVDAAWLKSALDQLPQELDQGHFGLLTSGSTGQPKVVIGSKERAAALAREIHHRQELAPVTATVIALPLAYSYAFVNQWLWSHLHGAALHHTRGFADPSTFFSTLSALDSLSSPTMLCLVGSQVPLLRVHLPPGARFGAVARLNFAGGAFPQHELDWLGEVFPCARVFNNYGCTEAMPRLCIREAGDDDDPAVVGRPLPGIELRAGAGDTLEFRSPFRAVAIVDPHGVRRIPDDEWVPTGDLGEPQGENWRLFGRSGDVFKRHGEKVSLPALLEAVGASRPGAAGFYLERDAAGELAHVLVLVPVPTPAEVRAVLAVFRQRFRRALWPLRIEGAGALPLLPNGKPDLRALATLQDRQVVWRQVG